MGVLMGDRLVVQKAVRLEDRTVDRTVDQMGVLKVGRLEAHSVGQMAVLKVGPTEAHLEDRSVDRLGFLQLQILILQ